MNAPEFLWFRLLAGLMIGLALGSFTTMLAYRVPRRLSVLQPPSHCPHCKTPLKFSDLVPVFSWLIGRGRCRHCHKKIGIRYLVIELCTLAATLAAFVVLGFQPALIAALLAIVAFITLAAMNSIRN